MRRSCAGICWLIALLVLPSAAAAQALGGIDETEEEEYWAFRDSAEALLARSMYAVALQEVDEALLLRPGDPDATALRNSIVAAMNPPTAAAKAKERPATRKSESVAPDPDAEHAFPPIDLTQAALALIRGDAEHLAPDWNSWRALVLVYVEGRAAARR